MITYELGKTANIKSLLFKQFNFMNVFPQINDNHYQIQVNINGGGITAVSLDKKAY